MNNIIKLIKLQYIHALSIRKYLIVLFTLSIIMMIMNKEFFIIGVTIMIMGLSYTVVAYEDRSKCENLIYALPVNPKQYILSKYVYGYINAALVLIIAVLINKFVTKGSVSSSEVMIYPLVIGGFMTCIIIPMALMFGFDKVRYILIFLCCFSIGIVQNVFPITYDINIGLNNQNIIFIIVFIVLNIVSYFVTANVYYKKDK